MTGSGNDWNEIENTAASQNDYEKMYGKLDHEVMQLTKLGSQPHKSFARMLPGESKSILSPVEMLSRREANITGRGRFSSADCCHLASRYLPVNGPGLIDNMNSAAYVSQFSNDGSICVAGFQESLIKIYNVDRGWKVQKEISAKSLRWNITDTSLSPDQHFLVYSSMSPIVHIVNTGYAANNTELHERLQFWVLDGVDDDFGIFSVKFSRDSKEIIAGTSDSSICVYDLGMNRLSLRFKAHMSDVNTVCFTDESGNIICSGSDDGLCKVWDRRCIGVTRQASGVLVGHIEGITFIDSRGDGHHLISNGKDQTIKLWDIRKMTSNLNQIYYHKNSMWDYRWMDFPDGLRHVTHPYDMSLATYKGHSVLRTLIRCYFSPQFSTGQKYIYTGSADGSVYVYDILTGAQVCKLVLHDGPVRDCSWHPFYPILVSSSWDGRILNYGFPDCVEKPPHSMQSLGRRGHRRSNAMG